ncbi:hypothetical protein [Streptomyces poonensis]|uniref:DUF3291 domain-containing protein n=1 Tax=Streptomyces poonensis TaxID=68255 RepID=A0A918PGX3_9ACTN|nr:hypothetical protein [Streptomyces poonensis]GGZ08705.1 hypothetical protein GCM10010365_30040 [Streptomyces poonensis]GLJ90507.1 hypothetical protein GCM10017589_31100 [Streptomyces poonensis]
MLRSRWCPGPAGDSLGDRVAANGIDNGMRGRVSGSLIVSVTDFTSDAYRDLPGIVRRGLALRRRWPHLEGAVGMWLWAAPSARRCGSVSVWTGRRALAEFVRLPEHVAIMDEYRERGTIRSVMWEYESLDAARIRQDAEVWLLSDDRRRAARGARREGR